MTFDDVVDSLTSLFDVTETKAAAIVNDRLQDLVTRSTALRAIISLGTTTDGTTSYTLASNVAKIFKAWVAYTDGTAVYEGTETIEDLVDLDAGIAQVVDTNSAYWVVIEADSDSDINTTNFRLYPTPGESGKTINGLVALRPATFTYGSASTLPIPTEVHRDLLEGAKAVLYAEEGREDEAAVPDSKYERGIVELRSGVEKRGKGSGSHRIKVVGYDLRRT